MFPKDLFIQQRCLDVPYLKLYLVPKLPIAKEGKLFVYAAYLNFGGIVIATFFPSSCSLTRVREATCIHFVFLSDRIKIIFAVVPRMMTIMRSSKIAVQRNHRHAKKKLHWNALKTGQCVPMGEIPDSPAKILHRAAIFRSLSCENRSAKQQGAVLRTSSQLFLIVMKRKIGS